MKIKMVGPKSEWVAEKAAKVNLSRSVLIFAQSPSRSKALLKLTLEKAPAYNAARFSAHVAATSFSQVHAYFDDNPADTPKDLVVFVDNVQPSQLLALFEFAQKGIKIHCTFSARL